MIGWMVVEWDSVAVEWDADGTTWVARHLAERERDALRRVQGGRWALAQVVLDEDSIVGEP